MSRDTHRSEELSRANWNLLLQETVLGVAMVLNEFYVKATRDRPMRVQIFRTALIASV